MRKRGWFVWLLLCMMVPASAGEKVPVDVPVSVKGSKPIGDYPVAAFEVPAGITEVSVIFDRTGMADPAARIHFTSEVSKDSGQTWQHFLGGTIHGGAITKGSPLRDSPVILPLPETTQAGWLMRGSITVESKAETFGAKVRLK